MATNKGKATAKVAAPTINVPAKLPKIEGMTAKAVANLYRAERLGPAGDGNGLGHVRVMTRLGKRSRGETVPAIATLRRYTEPVEARA